MRTSKPILGKNLSFHWRQAIAQNQTRGLTIKNLLRYRGLTNDFKYKEHETFVLDFLICGNNPIINTLFLHKINEAILSDHFNKTIKVGILLEDDGLYWGYHTFENNLFYNEINQKTNGTFQNSPELFFKSIQSLFQGKNEIEIYLIENKNISISNINHDQFTKSHVIHLVDRREQPPMSSPQMVKTIFSENKIRQKYENLFISNLNSLSVKSNNIFKLVFSDEKKHSIDSQLHSHVLIAKEIFFTSLPTWLHIEHSISTEQDTSVINFSHQYSNNSFASAKHCTEDFKHLSRQAINDVYDLYQKQPKQLFKNS